MKDYATVYLPKPGDICHEGNGARVELPSGEIVPHVSAIRIDAVGCEIVEVTVKIWARVETVK